MLHRGFAPVGQVAHLHVHVGAACSFELLWTHLMSRRDRLEFGGDPKLPWGWTTEAWGAALTYAALARRVLACAMARASLSTRGWTPLPVRDVLALGSDSAHADPAALLFRELWDLFETPDHVRRFFRSYSYLGLDPNDLPQDGATISRSSWMSEVVQALLLRHVPIEAVCERLNLVFPRAGAVITRIREQWHKAMRIHVT